MNHSRIFFLGFVLLFIVSFPLASFSEDRTGSYFVVKPGAYFPTGNLDDKGFVNSFSGEVAVGTYYTPNVALELGSGYFRSQSSNGGLELGSSEKDTIWAVPLTVTFKGVLPLGSAELYLGGGGGVYFTEINAKGSNASGNFNVDAHEVAIGGHVVGGGDIALTRHIFVGAEGKYIFTNDVHPFGTKVQLNGVMLLGVLGYRL
jgi:outer membrane protein W